MYSAQGVLVCHPRPHLQPSSMVEQFSTLHPYRECDVDVDCLNKQESCRPMPVSLNATAKVCMPHTKVYTLSFPV